MKKHLFIFLLLVLGSQVKAQVRFNSLEQCTDYALKNRPDLQNEELAEKKAQNAVKQVSAVLLPQVKATSALDDYLGLPVQLVPAEFLGGQPGEFRSIQFGTQYNLSYGLEAALPLVNVQAWKNRKIAESDVKAVHYQKLNAYQRAQEEISRVYYATLLSRQVTQIARENAFINDSLLFIADQKFKSGLLETLDYNRLKALQLESRQLWQDNRTAYEKNLNLLKNLCGLPPEASLELSETLQANQLEKVTLASPVEQQNGYQVLQWRIRAAEQEWQKQKLRWLPEVSAYGRYTRQAQRREFNFLDSDYPWFQIGLIGLRADWPLFTGFNRSVATRQAGLNHQMVQNELKNYQLRTQYELAEININYQNTIQSLQSYQQHYNLYGENYKLAVFKYKADVYSVDQLLQVYAEKLKSQNQFIQAMANYYINRSLIQLKNQSAQPENTIKP
ncbi:hypothetical protein AAE02nite_48780 [Adhaeribacter aerolatus]|uniref:Transporter n=1 Tax=Adhaeribacter aerolatus TaxID=670289 RepID=A0A512B5J2_9BACT|nr:TolC family protein [Adhaeribacter aerolatus]GEO07214.1 hypothetical protein AAE02nite_48780 [Adhaeribacter aerolatus]